MEVEASVISFTVRIEESIDAFTPERLAAIRVSLAAELACSAPACYIELVLAAGSVNLGVVLTIPKQPDGSDGDTPAVLASASDLLSSQTRQAAIFGATASASSTSPNIERDVAVLVAVATSPSPLPLASPPPPNSPLPPDGVSPLSDEDNESSNFPIGAVVGPVVGIAVLIAVAVGVYLFLRRRKHSRPNIQRGSTSISSPVDDEKEDDLLGEISSASGVVSAHV